MTTHHVRTACRLCGSAALSDALALSATPPANAFAKTETEARAQPRYPLTLKHCGECGHLQLVDVIDPGVLFRDYVYVSGTSPSFVDHFRRYADTVAAKATLSKGDFVVDIGSNDGTFLRFFQDLGFIVLGVDPAEKIAAAANQAGVPTQCGFFDTSRARRIREEHGTARLVTANNVFAHVDDLAGIVEGVREVLDEDGLFVFEVSYLVDVIQGTLFDTIYHEHLDYHRVAPLRLFFKRLGMTLVDVERVATHGGSLRGFAAMGERAESRFVEELSELETDLGLDNAATLRAFQSKINETGTELKTLLSGLLADGKKIAAYGAPAKATTLMHQFGLDHTMVSYVVDDSSWKQGLYTPGIGIPVVSAATLETDPVDYLLILAWNFADPIINKNKSFADTGGRFIVPLPHPRIHHS